MPQACDLVDLERYPLDDLQSEAAVSAIEQVRERLRSDAACPLPGFLVPAAVERMAREANELAERGWPTPDSITPYYDKEMDGFPTGHPRRTHQLCRMSLVGDHHIPESAALRKLYEWPPLRAFLARLLGLEELHPFADPCQTINLSVLAEGGQQPWHFDSARFTVTLMLQRSHSGGDFEYVPRVRTPQEENYGSVAQILAGKRDRVRAVSLEPGTLCVLLGEDSLHRVTPVAGDRLRLLATYLFEPKPKRTAVWSTNLSLYGPSAEAAMQRAGMKAGGSDGDDF